MKAPIRSTEVESVEAHIRQRFSVTFEYDVTFTDTIFDPSNAALVDALSVREPERRHRVVAILDDGLAAAWPETVPALRSYFDRHSTHLELAGAPILVPGGERAKNDPEIVSRLHASFHERRIDRQSFVMIVGGGAVQDAAGYAAATAHRGIRTVRLPTTVLSQCDSGVGVKNGVNAFGAKNFVGTFSPPFAVLNDGHFLQRLPSRDRRAGFAEAVKVALIRDAAFFSWIEGAAASLAAGELSVMNEAIRRCAELHLRHIATGGDPFEVGSARPLDFGHWAAHKLEVLSLHELRHGEAVAIGMLLDSRYALEAGLLSEADFGRIHAVLAALELGRWHDALDAVGTTGRPALFDGLDEFREHLGGELTITLLTGIGRSVEVHSIDSTLMAKALGWLRDSPNMVSLPR